MASDYILSIKLDDSQLNRQLEKFKQAFGTGGSSSSGSGEQSKSPFGKLAKFGLMALGVGEIVKMVRKVTSLLVDSSPMLKQMMNLFNNELMLMLMPIGNFIGFVLQPILMVLLRYVVMPFYRYMMPLAQRYGLQLGDGIARLIVPMLGFFTDPVGSLKGVFDNMPAAVRAIVDTAIPIAGIMDLLTHLPQVSKAFGDFAKWLGTGILTGISVAGDAISNVFSTIASAFGVIKNSIFSELGKDWASIVQWFMGAGSDISKTIMGAWNSLVSFFGIIGGAIGWMKNQAWVGLANFFTGIMQAVNGDLGKAFGSIVKFFVGVGNTLVNTWNWFADSIRKLTGGFINLPDIGGGGGAVTVSSMSQTSSTSGGMTGIAGHSVVVNVTVHGSVISENDLNTKIKKVVQNVQRQYYAGRP